MYLDYRYIQKHTRHKQEGDRENTAARDESGKAGTEDAIEVEQPLARRQRIERSIEISSLSISPAAARRESRDFTRRRVMRSTRGRGI